MLPAIGTAKMKRMIPKRRIAMVIPRQRYGINLPSIRPQLLSGLTSSCSRVPRSRSRTTAMAVAKVVPICRTTPMTPGTKKFGLRIVGL